MNETLSVIKSRRSIKSFKPEQIKDTELEAILEAGTYAPSASNQQSWHFTVVQNERLIDQLSEAIKKVYAMMPVSFLEQMKNDKKAQFLQKIGNNEKVHLFHNSPTIVVISGDKTEMYTAENCSLAAGNMMNAAKSLDVGSCWVSGLPQLIDADPDNQFIKELNIPEGYKPVCVILLGYNAGADTKAPERRKNVVNYVK
ncbi:nitroreductase [Clostridium sp. DL-VIII]|uniref:nitroreductase family protein n=1 Tax=Clostridium sp. DL-VIII TaxID=641107 RepID=UPI00023AFA49|nr:nitroreductase family protein [Clostridium sp. DL-VIII]EHI98757.1 nitroreductase [Clostridium sp. DL-VIII]